MLLELDDVHVFYGKIEALKGVSFEVDRGEIVAMIGANGAGKTTTMRIVLDILRPDAGSATWQGHSVDRLPRRTWGYLPEERGLYPRMKVVDQLVFFASLYGVAPKTARREIHEWLERFRIPEYADRRAEELSKGNQQKIQFIAAILHDPDVLLMDEPFVGLDPVNVALLKDAFLEMRERGKTLVLSTHQMEMVEELCESLVIIDRGRIVVSGPVHEVRRASGRQVVRLGVMGDGDLPWLADLDGVHVLRPGQDYTEMYVDAGRDPESILDHARAHGEHITRFEIADPSIEQVFIDHVGPLALEETRLAARATGSTTAAPAAGVAR